MRLLMILLLFSVEVLLPELSALANIMPAPKQHSRLLRIVIDPGHGGRDPGAIGVGGVQEKTIVLAIAKQLANDLNRVPGIQAVLTRDRDRYLTLRQRRQCARRRHANLLISIHADAFRHPHAHGLSVFALSLQGASSEAARWLARSENAASRIGEVKLKHYKDPMVRVVLIHMQQDAVIATSMQVGRAILHQVRDLSELHADHVERAGFLVLMAPDVPSLLVETGFISNRHEAHLLSQRRYQARLAQTLAWGIINYYRRYPVLL